MLFAMLIFTIITPTNVKASSTDFMDSNLTEYSDLMIDEFSIGEIDFKMESLNTTNNKVILNIEGESFENTVEVFLDSGDFIIEDENGVKESYNVKDFEVSEDVIDLTDTEGTNVGRLRGGDDEYTTLYTQINERKFLGGMGEELGFSKNTTFTNTAQIIKRGYLVYIFKGTEWKLTKAPKKYSFSAGTAVAVIAAVFSAYFGFGFTMAGLAALLNGLGVTFIGETLNMALDPTLSVTQKNVGRYYYVYNYGGTTKTLIKYNYVKVNSKGKEVLKHYSTELGYKTSWFQNYSDTQVAEVAAERTNWLRGLRQYPPYKTEFSWVK